MLRKVNTLILTLFATLCANAQMGKLFDANQQLSSSFTTQVYLDNDGFIWSATRNGLNKYDGYLFRILKKGQDTEMGSNYVNCMIQDKQGLFYMGMWGALQTYDGIKFHEVKVKDINGHDVQPYVSCFLRRKNGEIWAGTSGLGVLKFDEPNKAHQVAGTANRLRNVHTINHMIEDQKGRLWIATRDEGLIVDDGKTVKNFFTTPPLSKSLSKICQDKKGNIYVGTINSGLYKLEGNDFVEIPGTHGKPIAELYSSREGKLMIGYDGAGLGIYDPSTGDITDNPFFSLEVDLTKCKIYSIIEDRGGNIWLGLLQKGLYMQPVREGGFNYLGYKLGTRNKIGSACVISTLIDAKGRAWIGTDKDGLYCLDSNQQLLKHFKEGFPATVMTIAEDSNGRIWIGSYNEGGGWIEPSNMQFHKYSFPQAANMSIFDICVDKSNNVWFGTMGYGLLMLDQSSGNLTAHTMKKGADENPKINSITNDYISQLSLSPDFKRIYVSTTMGICCYDIPTASWTSFFGKNCPNYGTPVRIAREYSGRLWVGTNIGLYTYDMLNKKLQFYDADEALNDNAIASIEQDQDGRLWIGTDHGLFCHNPKTMLTQNYFIDNGLQSNEFSDGASWSTPNGVMVFGGVGGITWFRPKSIAQVKWDATVQLTAFTINGEQVNSTTESGRFHVTDTAVIASKHFELGYHDNSFAIQLSTLTYDNPEHITYLYSINGEQFVRLQPGANEITFSHLAPGKYHFQVKAERNNIETPIREFTIVVHAPWYRSNTAYLIYLLLIAFAVWQYLKMQKRREQERLRLQQHIHAEEMGEAKLRFFMNISHEIRTPMTLIVTPLLSLIKNETDPQKKSIYETIKRNSERILHLINQMMDLRKIDKGQMQMRMRETDLVGFVKDIFTLFQHQAKTKNVNLNFIHDGVEELPVWIDRGNFDKVIVNILSNAFKFTPTGGEINIRLSHDNKNASIAISDNGEKIPAEKLSKIFERFYQTTSTVNDRNVGTGIGLDLTRSLVELHHGTIEAHNLDQGCEFIVTIPLGNSHLRPEEIVTEEEEETSTMDTLTTELDDTTESQPKPVLQRSTQTTIVLAEDDDEIRDYLCNELSSDYVVKACTNGLEALNETLRNMPDLVISDIMMPEMDGKSLCSKIKSNPSTNHIPIILLTAKNLDEDKLQGLELGADAYIVKPFNLGILRQTIVNLINTHQLLKLKYLRNDNLEEKVDDIHIQTPDEKLMERVINTINQHISDPDLSVDAIADQVGISRVHLHRKMKELTGQTPHNFIRNIRLKRAANLLSNQGMNVTEVMYACGFANSTSFSTVFKKFYGLSPRDYMKEHGNR